VRRPLFRLGTEISFIQLTLIENVMNYYKNLTAVFFALALPINALAVEVVPPSLHTSQLTAQWWQWAMSFPEENSPVADRTGTKCALGQSGDIWFLAGGFGSSKIRRTCHLPKGKTLFFPLVNMVYWRHQEDTGFSCEQAKRLAALNNDTALDLFAEIDGIPIANLKQHRVASNKCFDVFARAPKSEGLYMAYPSATDGYWLQVRPLSPGRHTLKFGGKYNRTSSDYGRMVQDIEYELLVK
jgi:hypothetical protein